MLANEAAVSPGDLVRFWRLDSLPVGSVIPEEWRGYTIRELQHRQSLIENSLPRVKVTDFSVVLEFCRPEWAQEPLTKTKYRNHEWKLLHPEHGILLMVGVSGWDCEVIKCSDQ